MHKDLSKFLEIVEQDAALQSKLTGSEDRWAIGVNLAKEKGFEITEEELHQAVLARYAAAPQVELDDDALDHVVGGRYGAWGSVGGPGLAGRYGAWGSVAGPTLNGRYGAWGNVTPKLR